MTPIRSAARPLLVLLGLLLWSVAAPLPSPAQSEVDLTAARQYATQLESNFWERAWERHLATRADDDGTIDWYYDARQELSTLTADYQNAIGEADGFWQHPQVQDYLQRRLLTVQPNPMMPGRPGAFRLRVLSTTTPNALALNDGTIILTTGLITTLETEAQLQAVLAHEVAHVVLDHALATYRSSKKSNRARKLLGSVVSGVTSVVTPGLGGRRPLEATVYDLSAGLATRYLDQDFIAAAGLKYDRDQERAANRLAQRWLLVHDQPPGALNAALRALDRAGLRSNATHGASFPESHPGADADRRRHLAAVMEDAGSDPAALDSTTAGPDRRYDTRIAAVLEHEAEMDLAARRFHSALTVLNRALRTEWATSETRLFTAIAVRNTTMGAAGAREALALLDEAEAGTDGPDPRIEAERALLRLRQGRPERARRHLTRCLAQIEETRTASDTSTAHANLHAWATKMQARLGD
jgi:predicted Zn-dependent protease